VVKYKRRALSIKPGEERASRRGYRGKGQRPFSAGTGRRHLHSDELREKGGGIEGGRKG